jgi:hypothetical protein
MLNKAALALSTQEKSWVNPMHRETAVYRVRQFSRLEAVDELSTAL